MRRLLHAAFARIKRSKAFWIELVFLIIWEFVILLANYQQAVRNGWEAEMPVTFAQIMFQYAVVLGITSAVFCSLFVGTEYHDGTIRNKLIIGQSRADIYMSNFISCMAAGMVQAFVTFLIVLAVGIPFMGRPQMEVLEIAQTCAVMLFICMAYAALFNLAAMLISSKSHVAVTNILWAFAFLVIAMYLSGELSEPEMINEMSFVNGEIVFGEEVPNPKYVSGVKRAVYLFLQDFLPGGQSLQITNAASLQELLKNPILPCMYSAVIMVLSNLAGILAFCRKDIK